MSKSTTVNQSSLEGFSLDFEFDKTWHQAKQHLRKHPETVQRIAKAEQR